MATALNANAYAGYEGYEGYDDNAHDAPPNARA